MPLSHFTIKALGGQRCYQKLPYANERARVSCRTQNAECRTQNAERRMMVSGIECETGRYIIYDKLKKGLGLGLGWVV